MAQPMNLTLDQLSQPEIVNGTVASYQFLKEIYDKQHSLATAYYGAPLWYHLSALNNGTGYCHYNVPPQVTRVYVAIWAAGDGTVTITVENEAGSAIDSTGTDLVVDTGFNATASTSPFEATPYYATNNESGATAAEGRTLTVIAGGVWTWSTAVLKVVAPANVMVAGVQIVPMHVNV